MSFQPYLALSAAAGSGKTFALSVRYISLLFMGESPSSILAATFTNKAAAEMRQRVVDSLRHLGENEAFLDAVLVETGLSREGLFKKQPEVLARFLSHSSYIVTLDSFFSSILRSASLELGLEPDFVTKEQGTDELEKHFLDEVQAAGLLSSLVKLAMDIEDKRFGKIFDLMQNFYKVDPLLPEQKESTLVIAKQEEACEALRLKMIKALTDAGAAARCMKQFETKSIKELFAKGLFEKETLGEHTWFKKAANDEIEGIYTTLKIELSKWAEAKESIVLQGLFRIYDYYRNANISNAKASGVLSFDDLTYFAYRLLSNEKIRDFLYFKIDSRFKHMLLDEFQDTSTLQFLLLRPLIDEIFAGLGQSEIKSFFYVGDTKQSLYRFRGGVEELFDKVARNYNIEIEQMDTNYRSSKYVVEQVNRWFEPTMQEYVPQRANGLKDDQGNEIEGYVEVVCPSAGSGTTLSTGSGTTLLAGSGTDTTSLGNSSVTEPVDVIDEAVKQVKQMLEQGVNIDEIALLVNTNKEGQALQEACEHAGISTLLKTSSSLKHIPHIAALVSMLSYLFDGEKINAFPLLLRIGKQLDEVDLSWFSVFMSPLQVLDRLVREFGYFEKDTNILKLLEFASGFADIPTLIEEFAASSIAVASHTVHGVQIMTIHGSKGLEFAYVILLDKLTRPNSDKSALMYHYDEHLHIDRVFYRIKGREYFDVAYNALVQQRKSATLKDRMNVLYVALTRAAEGLVVIKKPKDSIFDALGMEEMSVGRLRQAQPTNTSSLPEPVEGGEEKVVIRNYGTQEVKSEESEEEKDYEAILFGTALHYALEMMGAFDTESLRYAMAALHKRYGQLLTQEQRADIEQRVTSLITNKNFSSMLNGAKITKEQSLSFGGELKQIDLLLEYEDRCMVVDYKSSKKYMIKHQNQVKLYQKAIMQIMGKPTSGAIIYLEKEEISILNLN